MARRHPHPPSPLGALLSRRHSRRTHRWLVPPRARTGAVVAVVVVLQGLAVRGAAVPIGPGDQARARGPVPRAAPRLPGPSRWQWPLEPAPAVVRRFQPAPTPWGAGHRGVDLAARPGQPVLAAGAGVVGFAGVIAGRGVITVVHQGGLRTTYEPVTARASRGAVVVAGEQIGRVDVTPGHCAPATCLHWGLLRGAGAATVYLDPLSLVGALGVDLKPPVLLPLRGLPLRGPTQAQVLVALSPGR